MSKTLLAFLVFVLCTNSKAAAGENPYESITKRNAFKLTDKEPAPPLPPAEKILAPSIFLTGITRWKETQKVHLVLRKTGEPDKFVSLVANEKQHNIELKKIFQYSVLVFVDGGDKLLSFEKNGLPTTVTKLIKTENPERISEDSDERKKRYEEYRRSRDK